MKTEPSIAETIRARGDATLLEKLLEEPAVRRAVVQAEATADEQGSRRELLGTALRLSPEMAPGLARSMKRCCRRLGIEAPVETYVYPSATFNAAAIRPERGLLLVLLTSSLLEAFAPDELEFVVGHELGHHLFGHHQLPVEAILDDENEVSAELALRLFAWQRYAEVSCDRAGLVCAGGLAPAARSLFKLASGLQGGKVKIRIDQFLAQIGDLKDEGERLERADEPVRSDWFSTHPFSPVRLRALELFSRSALFAKRGGSREKLESRVAELMSIMDPSYLSEKSDEAESMRRLLFAGAIALATATTGALGRREAKALERLLGPGAIPGGLDVPRVKADLPARIEAVKSGVAPLRRAQVIRDLAVVARADGHISEAERRIVNGIAEAIGVDPSLAGLRGRGKRERRGAASRVHATTR